MLTELEKRIVAEIQGDINISERPYLDIAQRMGIDEDILLDTLTDMCDRGVIRRFGATLRHQKSGYTANAMTAWQVEEDRADDVGEQMAAFRQISHCYRRKTTPEWPYNLYTMIHGKNENACRAIAQEISERMAIDTYIILFSREELKKTSMAYFPSDQTP
jgi:siroheme decarboxylase